MISTVKCSVEELCTKNAKIVQKSVKTAKTKSKDIYVFALLLCVLSYATKKEFTPRRKLPEIPDILAFLTFLASLP